MTNNKLNLPAHGFSSRQISAFKAGLSNSELQASTASTKDPISPFAFNEMSIERKSSLQESMVGNPIEKTAGIVAGLSSKKESSLTKVAQLASTAGFAGSSDLAIQAPDIYNPLWLDSNISLPRNRATVNAWCRAHHQLNPIVYNAINLHSNYPISQLNIKCSEKSIENDCNDMMEEMDLLNVCRSIAQSFWLLGEAFPYLELNKATGFWQRCNLLSPDYCDVQKGYNENAILLRPDEHMKSVIMGNSKQDRAYQKSIPQYFIESIRQQGFTVLDNARVSHLSLAANPGDLRGTGLPVSIFRQLMLFDMARESQYVQYQDMINPWRIIKVGDADNKPTQAVLNETRDLFEQAQNNKSFKLFTHNAITVEAMGVGGQILDTLPGIQQLIKEIHIGLLTPTVITEGGSDITYANGGVSLDALRQRYMSFRSMLATWLRRKVFAPIAEYQGWYTTEKGSGRKRLIIPSVEFNYMQLFNTVDYINIIKELATGGKDGEQAVSKQTMYKVLGLDEQDEAVSIRKEAIQSAILKQEIAALSKMSLQQLRSLDEDTPINMPADDEAGDKKDGDKPGDGGLGGADSPVAGESGPEGIAAPSLI
jgi:hypothetical protein